MIVPNFIMLATAYASTLNITVPLAIVMQKSWNDVYAISVSDKLSYRPSVPKKIMETIKQCEHNFDVNLGQIDVQNQKRSLFSLSEVFDCYKNSNVLSASLKYYCKQTVQKYSVEQIVLDFYDRANFKSGFIDLYVQKNAAYVEMETSVLIDEKSQEPVQLHARKAEPIINIESLPISLEEDAFAHKESSTRDAFTIEDSLLERQKE
ncbi:trwN protein [Bartonella pachyuromydis]|uniref:Uncharacterized protein n=1 Tax=Bartonella pachyuromydis TaxID=931097 RepID=A0ABP8VB32_9HYPH